MCCFGFFCIFLNNTITSSLLLISIVWINIKDYYVVFLFFKIYSFISSTTFIIVSI